MSKHEKIYNYENILEKKLKNIIQPNLVLLSYLEVVPTS
jgi:hypothetical protein